ncbi:MAG: CvpA family protein [Spirochaetaceae bacterium]|jgi:membrane protein required for colicin V production|nr:CvpA family protein [Spirochaetaceae bacterium]
MPLVSLDIALGAVILIFAVRAGLRGFVREAGGLAAWTLGLIFAVSFYGRGAAFLAQTLQEQNKTFPQAALFAAAFAALFLIVFLAVKFVGAMLNEIKERLGFHAVDACFGAVFGIVEGIAISALVIFIIEHQPLFDKNIILNGSFFYSVLGGAVKTASMRILFL